VIETGSETPVGRGNCNAAFCGNVVITTLS
jgi:hypothetical protein